ncbi:Caleosin-domain-containing protein, partial [Calocera cornea HHB12733]
KERTVLQKHCDFFDPDGDGVIWPWDTFFGFWVLGYALPICIFAVFAIHGPFSWPTQPRFPLPDLFWRIYIDRITAAKHGSDSGSYDREGGFDQTAFDKMFQANAKMRPDALTGKELFHLIRRNRVVYDPFGWVAGLFEWVSVWLLFWPGDNLFRKSDIKKLYDGTLFYETAYSQKMKGR